MCENVAHVCAKMLQCNVKMSKLHSNYYLYITNVDMLYFSIFIVYPFLLCSKIICNFVGKTRGNSDDDLVQIL